MMLSFNQGCTRENSTLAQDLELCEKAGFDYIELRTDKVHEYLQTHTLEDLQRFFASAHLKAHAMNGTYLYDGFLLEGDDPTQQKTLLDEILFGCEVGRQVGSPAMIAVPPMHPETTGTPFTTPWEDYFPRLVQTFKRLSAMVVPYGMNIGIEMVGSPRCSLRTIEQTKLVVDAVAQDNVGYCLDAYNLYLYDKTNDFSSILRLDPRQIFVAHINGAERDLPLERLLQANRTFCDRGVMNVSNFLGCLDKIGYTGMVSIEFFRPDCWAKPAQWVVEEAFQTSRTVLERCGVYH